MRVAVTGGMGFIGRRVVDDLLNDGHAVTVVDFWQQVFSEHESAAYPRLKDLYRLASSCELMTPDELLLELIRFDAVVHFGAVVDTQDMGHDGRLFARNVEYTKSLVERLGSRPIIFASSAAVYGSSSFPNNPYGLSKLLGERIVGQARHYRILRLFNVFGDDEQHKGSMASVPWKIASSYDHDRKFEMHSPEASRDFISVRAVSDVVSTLLKARFWNSSNETYDVGTGRSTTFNDLDTFIMNAKKEQKTCCRIVQMPAELVGRYQSYTRAGASGIKVLGSSYDTRDEIEALYGRQDK